MMDDSELLQLKQQATDGLIKYVDDEELYRLAQALEIAVEGSEDFDAMADKVTALEEENDILRSDIESMKDALREVREVIKQADSELEKLLK